MKTVRKTKVYQASQEEVFDTLDDLGISGMHMTKSSMPMMGGELNLSFLTEFTKGPNTRYRWTGKVLWWKMDFTVQVMNWIKGREKTWETVGPARLIIFSWFRMELKVNPVPEGTLVELSISYKKPKGFLNLLLFYLLGGWYCRWCIDNMLGDTKRKLSESRSIIPAST